MRTTIECANCEGGGDDLQFWITVGALVVAFLALLMNFVQFREFLRRSKARAQFRVAPRLLNDVASGGVIRTSGATVVVRVRIVITNVGRLAAGETAVTVLVPHALDVWGWTGPNGEQEERANLSESYEGLRHFDGTACEALAFSRTLPRVGVKIPHTLYFMGYVDAPGRGEKIEIPIRVIARADEMPEQVERYEEGIIFWVEGEAES